MKVKIRGVVDYGTLNSERLILDVTDATDIGEYITLDTTFTSDGKVSNLVRHPYWFPDQPVKKGDVIVLYTKKGSATTQDKNDHKIYFYYWGLGSPIWNNDGDCALLLHIDEWTHKKAN